LFEPSIIPNTRVFIFLLSLDKENAEKMQSHMRNMWHICEFLHMRHNFRICDSENAIICGKICDMRVLAKYAIACAIAYSHITNIPNCNILSWPVSASLYYTEILFVCCEILLLIFPACIPVSLSSVLQPYFVISVCGCLVVILISC